MEKVSLGQVIASRTLSLTDGREITVRIGMPYVPTDFPNDCCCPYQIEGLGSGKVHRIMGIDAFQALQLALMTIGVDLYASEEGKAGQIRWLDQRDLGFPVVKGFEDLLPE